MIGCTHPKVSTPNASDKEYIYNTLSTTKGINVCYNRLQTDNACCVDFYLDPHLKTCRPCYGSFGHNCSLRCPDGYYGHGCRQKCDCVNNQKCDPKSGCILWKNRHEKDEE
uniref:Multiple epidermal growth factor-like domains protein 10 n=1 Tax=Crassostrea virginica TaxID=6565 RepID=A0A8B8CN43_CRAVI|nr:multiple epidermal growth factor-like domains protein 10 [Crassostrea virginica]